jgi:hypothetical protein
MAELAAVIASTHHRFYYKASPDVLLMVGADHFHQLWLDNMPQFLVGHAEQYDANWSNEEREFGLPRMHMQGDRDLSGHILREGLDAGFDLAFSSELRIDHSVTCPIITCGHRTTCRSCPSTRTSSLRRCHSQSASSSSVGRSASWSSMAQRQACRRHRHGAPVPRVRAEAGPLHPSVRRHHDVSSARAAVPRVHGEPPVVEAREAPRPTSGHALVDVHAAPITPLDVLCATGTSYFGVPAVPYIPGVQEVGPHPRRQLTHPGHTGLVLHRGRDAAGRRQSRLGRQCPRG